jgi:hypothetical protein
LTINAISTLKAQKKRQAERKSEQVQNEQKAREQVQKILGQRTQKTPTKKIITTR